LIEALTYRMAGHSTSDDPTIYRATEELDAWRERDPVERLRAHLESIGAWDAARETELARVTDDEVKAAIEQAEHTQTPSLESMFDDVYCEMPWHLREQQGDLVEGPRAPGHH
jgi:2-oxoisovalerate dehydrogenase E1 component alpha subunit